MRRSRLFLIGLATATLASTGVQAQLPTKPMTAPMSARSPFEGSQAIARAVGVPVRYQTERSREALANRLVPLINAGRCDRAVALADNDRDGGLEMVRRVRYFCAKQAALPTVSPE